MGFVDEWSSASVPEASDDTPDWNSHVPRIEDEEGPNRMYVGACVLGEHDQLNLEYASRDLLVIQNRSFGRSISSTNHKFAAAALLQHPRLTLTQPA